MSLKRVTGRIFKINTVSNFKGASYNFEFDFFSSTKKQKIVKTIRACTESTYFYHQTSKKYLARDTIPLKGGNTIDEKFGQSNIIFMYIKNSFKPQKIVVL